MAITSAKIVAIKSASHHDNNICQGNNQKQHQMA